MGYGPVEVGSGRGVSGMRGVIWAVAACASLGACVGGGDGLRRFEDRSGPDEFSVQPANPLEVPEALTLPTPGGANRADVDPVGSAIVALGGRPDVDSGGVPGRDAALVAQVSRHGVQPDIRTVLAAEDAAFRTRRARLGGWFNWLGRDRYFQAYSGQALDAYAELQRFRDAGVAVPSAPPVQ